MAVRSTIRPDPCRFPSSHSTLSSPSQEPDTCGRYSVREPPRPRRSSRVPVRSFRGDRRSRLGRHSPGAHRAVVLLSIRHRWLDTLDAGHVLVGSRGGGNPRRVISRTSLTQGRRSSDELLTDPAVPIPVAPLESVADMSPDFCGPYSLICGDFQAHPHGHRDQPVLRTALRGILPQSLSQVVAIAEGGYRSDRDTPGEVEPTIVEAKECIASCTRKLIQYCRYFVIGLEGTNRPRRGTRAAALPMGRALPWCEPPWQ